MAVSEEMIVAASEADAATLTVVKSSFEARQVAERFRWLREDVDGTWLLYRRNDAIIGWCVVVWSGKETHEEYPDMQDLYVRQAHRNQGHGSRMISEIERIANVRGHDKLGLAVNPDDNPSAKRLYERLGYRHDGGRRYLDGVYNGYEDWVIDLEKQLL